MKSELDIKKKLRGTPKAPTSRIYKSEQKFENNSSFQDGKSSTSKKVAISSIHFKKVNIHSFKHNAREEEKTAETIFSEYTHNNEFDIGAKEALKKFNDLYKNAKDKRLKNGKNKTADKKNTLWEAIVNLKREHNLDDIKKLAAKIEKETSFTLIQCAIHKDEGQEKEGKLIRKNHHAHLSFFTLEKDDGQQMYRREHMNRSKLIKLQDIVAEHLGMERGKRGSKAKRLEHKVYKLIAKEREVYEEKSLYLKEEISRVRTQLQEQNSSRPDYAKLEQINKDLKNKIFDKEVSLEDLKTNVKKKLETITYQNKLLDEKKEVISDYIDEDKQRRLYTNGKIITERVKIKDSLFKSKEVLIYKKESVEAFIETAKGNETFLKNEIVDLESKNLILNDNNTKLEKLKTFMISHFKTLDMDKAIEIIKGNIPKVEKKNKQQSRDLER